MRSYLTVQLMADTLGINHNPFGGRICICGVRLWCRTSSLFYAYHNQKWYDILGNLVWSYTLCFGTCFVIIGGLFWNQLGNNMIAYLEDLHTSEAWYLTNVEY
jgi:hypothetical protein